MSNTEPQYYIDPATGKPGPGARPSCLGSEHREAKQSVLPENTLTPKRKKRGLLVFLKGIFLKKLFIYFLLRWVFVAACGLSLVVVSRGYSSLQCTGFSLRLLLLLWSTGSRRPGFSSCGTQPQ